LSSTSSSARVTPDRLRYSLLSQGGSQVFKLVVAIGIGGWMARYLGPQKLGTLAYVTALVGLLGPLGNLGVNGSLSAMLCEEQPQPGLLASALLIELVGTAVIAVVLIPFAWFARDPVIVGLISLAVVANLLSSSEVFEVELLNRHQGTQLARVSTIQTVAGAFLSVIALLLHAPLLVFGSLPALQAAIRAWLLAVAVQSAQPLRLLRQASWKTSRALIQRGWPLLLAGLSVMLYMKSDQVMLEWLRGPDDVGQYSVAVRVAESLYFLPVVLSKTFLPRIGRGTGQFDSDPVLRQLYRSAWFLGVGMLVASMLLLPPLIPLVFGDQFLPAQSALIWLGPAAFAVSTGCASGDWLNTQGHQKVIAQRSIAGALVNIILNFLLIPGIGFVGAALATSVSQFASVYLVGVVQRDIARNFVYLLYPFR
jgi:O-antigen/teichoic acid export membrane protein